MRETKNLSGNLNRMRQQSTTENSRHVMSTKYCGYKFIFRFTI